MAVQKSASSKATAIFYVRSILAICERSRPEEGQACDPEGPEKWQERRWRLFSTAPDMISDIHDRDFDGIIENSSLPILVEFWKPGCGHCLALRKELDLIQSEVGDQLAIYTMNVQENFLIPGEMDIQSLPALALFVEGEFEKFIGGIGKKENLLRQLAAWLPPAT